MFDVKNAQRILTDYVKEEGEFNLLLKFCQNLKNSVDNILIVNGQTDVKESSQMEIF